MTPIVSYWSAADMLWMDGRGQDGQGACWSDAPDACGSSARFYDFSVQDIPASSHCGLMLTRQRPAPPRPPRTTAAPPARAPREPGEQTPLLAAAGLAAGGLAAAVAMAVARGRRPPAGAGE